MTNRKYAGLLEGKDEQERLQSALAIIKPYVEDLVDKYKDKLIANKVDSQGMNEMFDAIGSTKLYKIAPELEDKYEIVVAITDNNVYVEEQIKTSWRMKQMRESVLGLDMDGLHVHSGVDRVTIDGNSITAGSIGTSQLSAGGVRFSVDGEYTRIDATRDLDLQIEDTVYHSVTIQDPPQTIFSPEVRQRIINEINEMTFTPYNGIVNTEGQGWVRRP